MGHSYPITIADDRTTEELVTAANYGYCHSQVFSDNFPARPFNGKTEREIALLSFGRPVSSEEATAEAAKQGLERPYYEDALYFGIEYPDVQLETPVGFPHDPWLGNHGRRDAICLWSNQGRRELGLEGFDDLACPLPVGFRASLHSCELGGLIRLPQSKSNPLIQVGGSLTQKLGTPIIPVSKDVSLWSNVPINLKNGAGCAYTDSGIARALPMEERFSNGGDSRAVIS